jgi:hypothetical protein
MPKPNPTLTEALALYKVISRRISAPNQENQENHIESRKSRESLQ